ncbi:hypothetical protein CL653_00010 [bacterium]|nr:hypothetical protein [bacterium]
MEQKKIFVVAAIALIAAVVLGLYFFGPSKEAKDPLKDQVVSNEDPVDIALDFYDNWLEATTSEGTSPEAAGLLDEPLLSQAMRDKLANLNEKPNRDPILCLDILPDKVSSKQLYTNSEETQLIVFSKEYPMAGQSIITMGAAKGGWYIKDISCSEEFDEPGEFSFEHAGNLLKTVPAPYDSQYWHLVFEQDGVFGHLVPMLFNEESICISQDGSESVCNENSLIETKPVVLRGNMIEAGVEVKELQLLNDL